MDDGEASLVTALKACGLYCHATFGVDNHFWLHNHFWIYNHYTVWKMAGYLWWPFSLKGCPKPQFQPLIKFSRSFVVQPYNALVQNISPSDFENAVGNMAGHLWWPFWMDGWNVFDFVVVSLGVISAYTINYKIFVPLSWQTISLKCSWIAKIPHKWL